MPGSTPPTSQLDWLISMTAMIVLFWVEGDEGPAQIVRLGHRGTPSLDAATKLPLPRRPIGTLSVPRCDLNAAGLTRAPGPTRAERRNCQLIHASELTAASRDSVKSEQCGCLLGTSDKAADPGCLELPTH